jgi:YbbR domain-containing protein
MKWNGKQIKERLVRNGKLKLFSAAFACVLWLLVNYGERDTEKTLLVPVELRDLPAQFIVTSPQVDFVDLRLRGPRTLLDGLKSKKVRLDLSAVRPGVASFRISASLLSLPRGVTATRISPAQINLEIARLITRTVPVRLETIGKPPRGYAISETEVTPNSVEVRGPAPQVERIQAIETQTVDVSRFTQETAQEVALRGPEDELVSYALEKVNARISVQEIMLTREFRHLKVEIRNPEFRSAVSPRRIDVTVSGPQRLVEDLRLDGGAVFVDAAGQTPGTVIVPVSVALPEGIELITREPSEVELQLVDGRQKKPQNTKTGSTPKHPKDS